MALSMHQVSVPVFQRTLQALSNCLDKAEAHAEARKIDPVALTGFRFYPDMFPFYKQVQLASDHGKGAPARLAGIEVPKFEDVETTLPDLRARIAKTLDFIATIDAKKMEGAEDREIKVGPAGRERVFTGYSYLFSHAFPNFFFHATTAYDMLRHNGVELGKRDFLNNS
jgi:hypothetical protein